MADAAQLTARANDLRNKLLPYPGGRALEAWTKIGPTSTVGGPQPKDSTAWLQSHSLKLGSVLGDGRCQYSAFSQAAFNTKEHADELRWLSVNYLRLHKLEFNDSMQADLQDRHYALTKLFTDQKINSVDYEGYMQALEKGLEWGNDHTLRAMTILMKLEARVIQNLNCPAAATEPRLHKVSKNPADKVGSIMGVIYLFHQGKHYWTIEEDLQATPQPPAVDRANSDWEECQGSIRTDPENDVTYDPEKPIRVDGEEYDARDLLGDGCSLGDGTRLQMRESDDGKEWVISRRYVQGNSAVFEVRRLPRTVTRGPPKWVRKDVPLASRIAHELDADPTPEDVQKFVAEFELRGLDATPMLAQKLYEVVTYYVVMLELVRNEADESSLGMLGNEVLDILEHLRTIKHRLAFTVTPESKPNQQLMVAGVAGAGKSLLINHLMRHCLKMEDEDPSEPDDVTIEDEVFSEGGSAPRDQLSATQRDEQKVVEDVVNKDDVVKDSFNIFKDDILPTGSGAGAMTALVTHVFLDPTASHLQLRLKYKERAEVQTVLGYAEKLREHGDQLRVRPDLPELPDIQDASGKDVDVRMQAYYACALLGLENKPNSPKRGDSDDEDDSDDSDEGDAPDEDDSDEDDSDEDDSDEGDALDAGVEQLQRHKGAFELPKRFEPLYGCERRLTLRGCSKSKLLVRMQQLLLAHTIGHWSHWAVLEKVELVVPSNLPAPLRVCDVPGFGDDSLDPYRQQLVTEALKQPCSTLCFLLKHARLRDDAQVAVQRLGKLGIYEDLFGLNKQRRIGKLMTVVALDWAAKEYIENNKSKPTHDIEDYLKRQHDRFSNDSRTLLKKKLEEGVKSRLQGTESTVRNRLNGVMKTMTQAFVVAVRNSVVDTYMNEDSERKWRMDDLVKALLSNNAENLRRQQEDCLEKLVGLCLLPFYSKLDQLGRLRSLKPDERLKKLNEKNLLEGVRGMFNNEFHAFANKMRADQLKVSILDPRVNACTPEAVTRRYDSEAEFEPYRRKGSHRLGNDMRSRSFKDTKLPELTMRPMANEVVLPLQDALGSMKKGLIDDPAEGLSKLVRTIIQDQIAANISQAPDQAGALRSAMTHLERGFLESVRDIKEAIHQKYSTQINQLPDIHTGFVQDALDLEELPNVAKKHSSNIKKRDVLAGKIYGETGMVQQLSRRLQEFLRKEVLDDFKDDYLQRVEKALKYLAGMIVKAQSGEIKDLEQLNAFHISQNCARRVAGMIQAVHKTGLAKQSFDPKRMPESDLSEILEFAKNECPLLCLAKPSEGNGIAALSGAVPRQPSAMEVESTDLVASGAPAEENGGGAVGDEWHCPNCGVAAADTDMSKLGLYGLKKPCLVKSQPVCWCESAQDQLVCRLCVRYFKLKHMPRKKSAEQSRQYNLSKRRASFSGADGAKRARSDEPSAPVSESQPAPRSPSVVSV